MIDIPVRVEEVVRRGRRDKSVAYFVSLRIDEGREPAFVRISRDVYHQVEAGLAGGRRFVMTLSVAPPTLDELASRETAEGAA